MTTVARWWPGPKRRVFALLLAGLVVIGVGAAVAAPPPSAAFDDLDGRTWVAVPGTSGTKLLSVNGISGLIEGDVDLAGATDAPVVVGSGTGRTLLHGEQGLVVVDDAGQQAEVLPGVAGAAAIVGERVLVVGGGADGVTLRDVDADDASRDGVVVVVVEGAPTPAADAVPVVDGRGRAWYLGDRSRRPVAAVVDPDGSVGQVDVDPGTTRLVVVDGAVHAESPAGVRQVGGTRSFDVPAPGGVGPTVAEATGGAWATAEGSVVQAGGGVAPQDVGAAVEAIAVWHGQVAVVTADGAFLGEPGALVPVPEVGSGATLHLDGGLLWITTADTAVAVDREHDLTVLRVADVDLSLCVGDCSAAAASRFLQENVTPTTAAPRRPAGPTVTTTTMPSRRLAADVVAPTLGHATTTAAVRPADTAPPPTVAAPAAPAAEADAVATTVETIAPTAAPPPGNGHGDGHGNGAGNDNGNGRPDDRPPRRPDPAPLPLPLPPAPPETTTTVSPPPDPEPEPEPEPVPAEVGLELDVVGGTMSAEATVRVLGSASDCGVADERRTRATFSWEGSGSGSREVDVTWSGAGNRSDQAHATLAPIPAGEVTVRVTVCGVAAEREVTVRPLVTTTTTAPPTTTPPTSTTPPTTTTPAVPTTTTTTTAPTTTVPTTTSTTRPTTSTTRPTTTTSAPPAP